jgi:AraC family transcriptional regulator, positive regulator of tynA and feaB
VRSAAETHIDHNLADTRLTPAAVAAAIGVSFRTLHRAFEGADDSVAGLIRTRRLVLAASLSGQGGARFGNAH